MRKIKPKLSEHKYKVLYPSGPLAERFCGTANIIKILKIVNIDQLPIRPIASNMNTSTYQLGKHLSKISPFREYKYNIKTAGHFMEIIKHKKVPEGFHGIV